MRSAITIIKDEHRSLAAVLQGLLFLIEEIRQARARPDFKLIEAMLRYIERFPERLHHPKEDQFLYRLLRSRDSSLAPLLDDLEAEHERGRPLVTHLLESACRYEKEGAPAFAPFADEMADYCRFQWAHMKKEEEGILPRAESVLTAEDWREIDAAFQSNEDPIGGANAGQEFRDLFRKIVTLAPPPIGVGPG
ncbi:MAG TPA: hemerythrin domain-containing protein [Telmatospirillum sp.]|nr:hemerythrin domain-containing protein [Telmatospirillum sp.]